MINIFFIICLINNQKIDILKTIFNLFRRRYKIIECMIVFVKDWEACLAKFEKNFLDKRKTIFAYWRSTNRLFF